MKLYPEGYAVEVVVNFTDLNGDPIVPTNLSAALYDGDDQLVVDFGDLPFDVETGSKAIVVAGEFNMLTGDETRAARILRVVLTTASGDVTRAHSYLLEGEFRLALMQNSFMTYEAAEILALDRANLNGWRVADEQKRYAALIEAFNRLTHLPMRFTDTLDQDHIVEEDHIILRQDWSEISAEEFLIFPDHFRKALRNAQLTEANELLQGDTLARKHRAGIVTETIGESSVTLRKGQIDYGVSNQTLSHLTGYIYFNMRIARA